MSKSQLNLLLEFLDSQGYETKEQIINYLTASNNGSLIKE